MKNTLKKNTLRNYLDSLLGTLISSLSLPKFIKKQVLSSFAPF